MAAIDPAPRPLVRSLGTFGVLLLTLSVTTPASSVFVIAPGMLRAAGTGALWATLIAAIVCVATALIYAELSSAWPVAGGEYVMVARTLGPLAGFVMLGVNVFSNLLFPPVAALGIAAVLGRLLPGLPPVPVAVAVVLLATSVALLRIRAGAAVTGAFLLVELLALAVVVWLGFARQVRPVGAMLAHPVAASSSGIGVAATIALFAFNGYGVAVYFAEEMHEAPRRIARAVLIAAALAIVSVALPIVAALAGAPDLPALLAADDPFGGLVAQLAPAWLAGAVAIGVAVAIVNAIIASILSCARFFYSSARDRCWGMPLDRWLGIVHPRSGAPWPGTLLIGGVTVAACFLPLDFLLVANGAGLIPIYAGMALATIAGRRSGRTARAPYRMPLYPLAPLLALAALGYVTWATWQDAGEGRLGLIATAAEAALSAAYYRLALRGRWTAGEPVPLPREWIKP